MSLASGQHNMPSTQQTPDMKISKLPPMDAGSSDGDGSKAGRQDEASSDGVPNQYIRVLGPLRLRGPTDDMPQDWWWCATAVPLIAATQGPLSNVLSIAALVNVWRVTLPNNGDLPEGVDESGEPMKDPQWELTCNGISLACGFLGNIFLLLHFIGRVRYIVALPLSILFWILSSGILIAITISINIYDPPIPPAEIYGQGYWHAVLAAGTYMFGALMLMTNMVGYLLGHYPQDFDLNDDQRTLILQTTMYFVWLAGGAGIYERLEHWSYANALYYCHVTILTIGYGDVVPATNAGRGFLFIYVPIGVIQLGLVISRISRFGAAISSDNIVKKHQARHRAMTIDRSVTSEKELRERLGLHPIPPATDKHLTASRRASASGASVASKAGSLSGLAQYGKFQRRGRTLTFSEHSQPHLRASASGAAISKHNTGGHGHKSNDDEEEPAPSRFLSRMPTIDRITSGLKAGSRRRLLILREEQDRFNAMRAIQKETKHFKSYTALIASIIVFAALWLLGGVIFMATEAHLLEITYFDSLYFCFVSLLTIGYGDISPRSNIGKPVFIVWSLVAVPSLTLLISAMSDTIVSYVDRKTNWLLPEKGFIKVILDANPKMKDRFTRTVERHNAQKRVEEGFQIQDPDEAPIVNNNEGRDDDVRQRQRSVLETDRPARERKERRGSGVAFASRVGLGGTGERRQESEKEEKSFTVHDFTHQLSVAIRRVARDVKLHPPKRYSFEEWLYFTKLIRFSSRASLQEAVAAARSREGQASSKAREEDDRLEAARRQGEAVMDDNEQESEQEREEEEDEEESGLMEWDWIGEDSPMLSDVSEAEWVLDRLCESLNRYARWRSHHRIDDQGRVRRKSDRNSK